MASPETPWVDDYVLPYAAAASKVRRGGMVMQVERGVKEHAYTVVRHGIAECKALCMCS